MYVSVWVQPLVWIPFWMLFSHDLYLWRHRKKTSVDPSPPETLSVVIPVINEADRIDSCITATKEHPAVREIIVVDGGSEYLNLPMIFAWSVWESASGTRYNFFGESL